MAEKQTLGRVLSARVNRLYQTLREWDKTRIKHPKKSITMHSLEDIIHGAFNDFIRDMKDLSLHHTNSIVFEKWQKSFNKVTEDWHDFNTGLEKTTPSAHLLPISLMDFQVILSRKLLQLWEDTETKWLETKEEAFKKQKRHKKAEFAFTLMKGVAGSALLVSGLFSFGIALSVPLLLRGSEAVAKEIYEFMSNILESVHSLEGATLSGFEVAAHLGSNKTEALNYTQSIIAAFKGEPWYCEEYSKNLALALTSTFQAQLTTLSSADQLTIIDQMICPLILMDWSLGYLRSDHKNVDQAIQRFIHWCRFPHRIPLKKFTIPKVMYFGEQIPASTVFAKAGLQVMLQRGDNAPKRLCFDIVSALEENKTIQSTIYTEGEHFGYRLATSMETRAYCQALADWKKNQREDDPTNIKQLIKTGKGEPLTMDSAQETMLVSAHSLKAHQNFWTGNIQPIEPVQLSVAQWQNQIEKRICKLEQDVTELRRRIEHIEEELNLYNQQQQRCRSNNNISFISNASAPLTRSASDDNIFCNTMTFNM